MDRRSCNRHDKREEYRSPSIGERPDVEFFNQFQFLADKLKTYLTKMIA